MRELVGPRPNGGLRRVAARLRARLFGAAERSGAKDPAQRKRHRIAAWAIGLGLIAGAIDLMLPAEDAFRAIRAAVRMHPADQTVLVVTVDDRSLNALGVNDPLRSDDARILDRLFELGAERVFFDRAYADATSVHEDRKFTDALERHRGRVFLGGTPPVFEQGDGSSAALLPHPRFRSSAEMVSIVGQETPFGLSVIFPTSSHILGKERRSLSAELARLDATGGSYRPDFAIDYATIPTVSYIDVLKGTAGETTVRGMDVVVAPSSRSGSDFHPMPFRGKVPGVYFHVIGAETLKRGYPLQLGWLPAFLVAGIFVIAQARRLRPSVRGSVAAAATLAFVPLILDLTNAVLDVMPAAICLAIGAVGLHRLSQKTYFGTTGLQRIELMQTLESVQGRDVLALKIRNFATISANLAPADIERLLAKALAMLRATDPGTEFAFTKDTFVWSRPRLPVAARDDHVHGLHTLFRTSISIGPQTPDVASSIGVDTNYEAPLRERVESALQCAEDAAHAGKICLVSEPLSPEDRQWRLQILSELESALRNDKVDVAFQPKISLSTGATVGAEALLRWNHPLRGPIKPAYIVAIAEVHDRVDMITSFVLNRALSQGRRAIARDPSFKIAINISALDLRDPMFLSRVEQIVAAHRFPAANLMFEVTETAPLGDDPAIADTLAGLKRMGAQISVDDFGTGYASLENLRLIPADEVKIDRGFVTRMDISREDYAIVRTAVEMIHSLGRTAVAEGVENLRVLELLREMGCDQAQGYLFSKPIAMDMLLAKHLPGVQAA